MTQSKPKHKTAKAQKAKTNKTKAEIQRKLELVLDGLNKCRCGQYFSKLVDKCPACHNPVREVEMQLDGQQAANAEPKVCKRDH